MTRLLIMLLSCLLLASVASPTLMAASAVDDFNEAMAGSDSTAKKKAIRALASGGEDSEVIPLLIGALSDRQARSIAVSTLRKRTGMKPGAKEGSNTGYPGYPRSDDAAGWNEWWSSKQAAAKQKQAIKDLEKKQAELAEQATATQEGDQEATATEEAEKTKPKPPATKFTDLGQLDRIFFTDGSMLTCYILMKRVDLDGNLTSVHVMHKDGAGEEVLSAELVARIDEDIK